MLIYLLKVNIVLALLYAFYRLFFYRDTFFNCRRILLMSIIALSLLAPLPSIHTWVAEIWLPEEITDIVITGVTLPEFIVTPSGTQVESRLWIWPAISWICMAGTCLLCGNIVVQLLTIWRPIYRYPKSRLNGIGIHTLPEGEAPFSFFRRIFVCPYAYNREELDEILTHEQTHARQWHSIDVLASELMCALCWFNPFAWLLKQEIKQNLEYLADRHVLSKGYNKKNYQYHLLGLAYHKAAATIYNNFNVLPLKKRISMMNKKRTPNIGRLKYLLFFPMAALLTVACGNQKQEQPAEKTGDTPATEAVTQPKTAVEATAAQPETSATETAATSDEQEKVYHMVDEKPVFPGGEMAMMEFIGANIHYPDKAIKDGKQGTVVCQFVVNSKGKISDVKIMRSVSPEMDAEAVRVIKSMPTWTPGKQDGKAVNTAYTLPIRFRLNQ